MIHRFYRVPKLGKKGAKKKQTHLIRVGSRQPGDAASKGSRRHPF